MKKKKFLSRLFVEHVFDDVNFSFYYDPLSDSLPKIGFTIEGYTKYYFISPLYVENYLTTNSITFLCNFLNHLKSFDYIQANYLHLKFRKYIPNYKL